MAQIFKHHQVHREEIIANTLLAPSTPTYGEEELYALKEEAYQQGYLQGQEDATTLAHQQMGTLKEQLEQLLCSIPQALEQQRFDLHTELAAITVLILQSYFAEQVIDKNVLETKINLLLGQINSQQLIELYLHANDIKALQNGEIKLSAIKNQITIKSDEALALGGFIIKTQHGIFDASLEKQINKLKDYLISMKSQELS
jgi:flagellar assembly protein FliH